MGNHGHFGKALRGLRERTAPAAAGLAASGRRRTRGLRREEVAELAGVSADYVRRLEQGRSHPSAEVVNALARALGADRADYEYLCALAGHAAAAGRVPRVLSSAARRLLERLPETPVCVCDSTWTVAAGNGAWQALRCGEPTGSVWDWNLVWRTFGSAPSRLRWTPPQQAAFEAMLVSDLRTAALRYPADETLSFLIDDMRSTARSFSTLWREGARGAVRQDHRATFVHPEVGDIVLDCDVVTIPGTDMRAMIFTTPPGSADAGRLSAAIGGTDRPERGIVRPRLERRADARLHEHGGPAARPSRVGSRTGR